MSERIDLLQSIKDANIVAIEANNSTISSLDEAIASLNAQIVSLDETKAALANDNSEYEAINDLINKWIKELS